MKKIIVLLILGIFLISGCQIPEEVEEKSGEPETETRIESAQKTDYTIEDLQEDINSLFERTNYDFIQDKEDPEYYNGNGQKILVIEVLDNEIKTANEFYTEFSASKWDKVHFYVNESEMNLLHPPLTRNNYLTDKVYMEYVQERTLVEQTTTEKTIELENGKVLEYQFMPWMQDPHGQFQGAWDDTLLIYKIYCSPNLIVFIRPDWEDLQWSSIGQKMEGAHKNWDLAVERLKPELLDIANSILGKCPVEKNFFNTLSDKEYLKTETLSYYFKNHLKYYWNLVTDVKTEVEKKNDEEYLLKKIEITFTNREPQILWGYLDLNVDTVADGKRDYIFVENKPIEGKKIAVNKSVTRGIIPIEDNKFSNNITINFELVYGPEELPIKPFSITIDKDNKVIGTS